MGLSDLRIHEIIQDGVSDSLGKLTSHNCGVWSGIQKSVNRRHINEFDLNHAGAAVAAGGVAELNIIQNAQLLVLHTSILGAGIVSPEYAESGTLYPGRELLIIGVIYMSVCHATDQCLRASSVMVEAVEMDT